MWTPVYYVRIVSLPHSVDAVTVPNDDGSFDIYINANLSEVRQKDRLQHEIKHIVEDHFYQEMKSLAQLELEANNVQISTVQYVPKESPSPTIPYFSSLNAFGDYVFSMRKQNQNEIKQRSVG